ncbi:MAG TPA: TIGR03545 family protein [Bacillota bacterium]
MRKKAVLIFTGFLILVTLICLCWGNSLLTWMLENTLQAVTRAKVEITGLRLRPFQLAVQMEKIELANPADPWKNLVSAKNIRFKMAPGPLWEGKKIIEEIAVEDLVFNERRRTDGRLKKKAAAPPKEKKESRLRQTLATIPVLKPETIAARLDLPKLTAGYQFRTDLAAAGLKAELNAYQERCDAHLEELNQLREELNILQEKAAGLKKPAHLQELHEQLAVVNEIRDGVEKIRTRLRAMDDRFQQDNQAVTEALRSLKAEAEADYRALLALAELPDLDESNYAEALLGETLFKATSTLLDLLEYVRKLRPVGGEKPAKTKPTRGGQDIAFPRRETHPRFLIKKIAISGRGTPDSSLDGFYAQGVITGITSEPALYGSPLTMALFAQTPREALFRLDGELNHVTPDFQDRINLTWQGLPLPELNLGDSSHLPAKILTGRVGIDAVLKMDPDLLKLVAVIKADQVKMDFSGRPEPDDLIGEIIRNTLVGLDQVTVHYELAQSAGEYELKISSDLDRVISARLQAAVGEKVTDFTRELRAKVEEKLHHTETSLEATKALSQQKVAAKLQEFEEELDRRAAELTAKQRELEAKKKELEEALQKKLDAEEERLKEKAEKELRKLKDLF